MIERVLAVHAVTARELVCALGNLSFDLKKWIRGKSGGFHGVDEPRKLLDVRALDYQGISDST